MFTKKLDKTKIFGKFAEIFTQEPKLKIPVYLPNYFRGQKGGKEKIPATCSKNNIHLFTEKSDLKVKTVKAGSLLVVL